jgi:type I site-specific restriction endonuclease
MGLFFSDGQQNQRNHAEGLAVLSSQFKVFEELSKSMLEKLGSAVEKISEGNQNVALILERHESRLDQAVKTDEHLIKTMDELRISLDKDMTDKDNDVQAKFNVIELKFKTYDTQIDEFKSLKNMILGMGAISVVLATVISQMSGVLFTGDKKTGTVESPDPQVQLERVTPAPFILRRNGNELYRYEIR